ncbi:MAG: twin-arginine translocation signal domain-containing protein, partial [Desulfobulbaceae bacterium]|nr:twin-arginine translocation signal domain-containing protein [Desulfobulbaceae bacterium]
MEENKNVLDSLIDMLNTGMTDRRNFLKMAAAAGITAISAKTVMAAPANNCLNCHDQAKGTSFTIDANTQELMDYAKSLGIDLIWDRGTPCQNSHNGNGGVAGLCCFRCQMGPCTLGAATSKNSEYGTCGASKDIVVARDLVRRIAGGTAAHVEHARAAAKTLKGVANHTIPDYEITDSAKLNAIYKGLGLGDPDYYTVDEKALAVAEKTLEDLGKDEGVPAWLEYKANAERQATWANLTGTSDPKKIINILPTGAGAELSEALHRTTMGVDGDMVHLATDGLKLGLVDGYCGLHPASNIQDVLFGTPMLQFAKCGLGVIEEDKINIIVNGHEPILSEKIVDAVNAYNETSPSTLINVVGMCCTGNEVLMRKGVNPAGAMVQQELALLTGVIEAMVVDVQCVIPNVQRVVTERGLHTKIITTNPHAMITGATHIAFVPEDANAIAEQIVGIAVANYTKRIASKVHIPLTAPQDIVAGFSVEQIVGALSAVSPTDPLGLLISLIASTDPNLRIRGIVGIVGCVTPRDTFGYRHVELTKRLLAKDILVVGTGCWAHAAGQYGLLAADPAYPGVGAGLKGVLQTVTNAVNVATGLELPAIPACWHMGSCVDNSRIEDVLNAVAGKAGVKISQLPVAASAPEFITEKAVSIGTWAVDLGLLTHIGGQPYVS